MLDQIKHSLKSHLANDLGRAFEELKKSLATHSAHLITFGTLYNRYSSYNIEKIKGTASYENMEMTRAQIVDGFLSLLDLLSDDDLSPELLLQSQIENISLASDLGEIHLVNCDRVAQSEYLWEKFGSFGQTHFQFYFINACNTQMPQSLAERAVYELIEFVLGNDDEALGIVMDEKTGRVRIENLPIGPTSQFSKNKFKTYFCERFEHEFGEANQLSFEDFLQTGIPKLRHQYIATVFQVNQWKANQMKDYFEWILGSFEAAHEDVPTFLFFLPVMLKGFDTEDVPAEHTSALEVIHQLCADFPAKATFIEPLKALPSSDLDAWLADLGEGNPLIRERIIASLVNTFLPERRAEILASNQLDMCEAEILQQKIYEFSQR